MKKKCSSKSLAANVYIIAIKMLYIQYHLLLNIYISYYHYLHLSIMKR